jgi:hypothetical protein
MSLPKGPWHARQVSFPPAAAVEPVEALVAAAVGLGAEVAEGATVAVGGILVGVAVGTAVTVGTLVAVGGTGVGVGVGAAAHPIRPNTSTQTNIQEYRDRNCTSIESSITFDLS